MAAAKPAPLTSKQTGDALEARVARALLRGGLGPVSRNVFFKDRFGNRSEIDVVYGWPRWRRVFVECKAYHGSGASVGLEEVAKFKEVLALNGIAPSRGLFITTTAFVPRARTIGVRTLNGVEFEAWERALARRGAARRAGALVCLGAALLGGGAVAAAALLAPGEAAPALQPLRAAGAAALVAAARAQQGWREGLGEAAGGGWLPPWLGGAPRGGGWAHDAGKAAGSAARAAREWWRRSLA
jgi:hypothetical protein